MSEGVGRALNHHRRIFHWVFGVSVWLSIVLAVLVTGIVIAAREGYLRTKDPT